MESRMSIERFWLTEDAKRLAEGDIIELAKQVQHLRNYLSAANSSDDLRPADMTEYGFSTSSELLDLCSAVRLGSLGFLD